MDSFSIRKLNGILEDFGLEKVDYILNAIYRLRHKYKSKEEKEQTCHALEKCFMEPIQANQRVASDII